MAATSTLPAVNMDNLVKELRERLGYDQKIKSDLPSGAQALYIAMDLAQRYGRNGSERKDLTQQLIKAAAAASDEAERRAWELAETEMERGMDKLIARVAKEDSAMAQSAAGCLSCCLHVIRARRDLRKQREAEAAAALAGAPASASMDRNSGGADETKTSA